MRCNLKATRRRPALITIYEAHNAPECIMEFLHNYTGEDAKSET